MDRSYPQTGAETKPCLDRDRADRGDAAIPTPRSVAGDFYRDGCARFAQTIRDLPLDADSADRLESFARLYEGIGVILGAYADAATVYVAAWMRYFEAISPNVRAILAEMGRGCDLIVPLNGRADKRRKRRRKRNRGRRGKV